MNTRSTCRGILLIAVSALLISGCGAEAGTASAQDLGSGANRYDVEARPARREVLLVHGAWANASSWSKVIEHLQRDGVSVHAVQLRMQSLNDDVAIVRHAIRQVSGELVVVGHSYGGAVVSGATAGEANVSSLVFVAAYAPDATESLGALNDSSAMTPIGAHLVFDDQMNATIDRAGVVEVFAPDVPATQAQVLFVTQPPFSGAIFAEGAESPGWLTIPSYFAVSSSDRVVSPDLQRFEATRMKAQTIEIASSHVSLISHAREVTALIERAVDAD